jgi:hypothetical protein
MNNFLNIILMGKGMRIRLNIGRNISQDERDGMIMDSMGRGKFLGGGKNNMVVGEDRLEERRVCRSTRTQSIGVPWLVE